MAAVGAIALAALLGAAKETPSAFVPVERDAAVGREAAVDRAFFGAPPPVPHFSPRQDDCLNCHAPENDIAKKWRAIAPIPHALYTQCYQCHVPKNRQALAPFVETDFVGLDFPGKGSREHDYAPPTTPHKVFMRENCLSCHGPAGDSRIRTEHPYRSQCLQCHVPEAEADYTRP